jgi:stress response protein YsnF
MEQEPEGHEKAPEVVATVAEERLRVQKVWKPRGRVQIRVASEKRRETVAIPLCELRAEVKRVPMDRWVDEPPQVRQEGDTLIVPVVKEMLIVEKRLKLVEEIHVLQKRDERVEERTLELRSEHATVTRAPE